ncbi:uncharacterized protein LOC105206979 isoform X5 [Solenopsis invicta]|uniref:uncharacterized protein LOC105206979 isoform X5 n=1 Tax=Solenopsis invicta TaxID=13686 RepID=UPI00193CB660|nr:uncharacterized protein LOC105206979 isoform X5 [Solenopsis invicta]
MLSNFVREYNINRVLLLTIGFWPFQSKHIKNLLWTSFFLLEISFCPWQILLLYNNSNDTKMIFEGCYQFILSVNFIGRQMNHLWNSDKCYTLNRLHTCYNQFRYLYKAIDEHWDIFTNDVEIQILNDYAKLSRKVTKYYAMLLYIMMVIFLAIPLTSPLLDIVMPLNESRPRFFAFVIDFKDKNEYFLPTSCYITAIGIVATNVMVSSDTTHIMCILHVCSLFAAISTQVENIIPKDNNIKINKREYEMGLDSSNEKITYQTYIKCLKKYQLALEFVDKLDSCNTTISLITLISVIGVISSAGIQIVFVKNHLNDLIKPLVILMGSLGCLMILCYSGQILTNESQNIFYRAAVIIGDYSLSFSDSI